MDVVTRKDVRRAAMDLLARREHLRQELLRKLRRRFPEYAGTDVVLDELASENLQSDDRFVAAYIRYRSGRGFGPSRIRQELKHRGAAAPAIELAMAASDIDWAELAKATRLKKFGPGEPQDFKEKSKQLRYMQYRGFGGALSAMVLEAD